MSNRFIHWDNVDDVDINWVLANHAKYSPGLVSCLMPAKLPAEFMPFIEFARSCVNPRKAVLRHCCVRVVSKDSVSKTHPGYGEGFPDLHNNGHVTICVCAQQAEAGGDWELDLPDGKIYHPGKTGNGIIIKGDEAHWATRVQGDTLRITFQAHFDGIWDEV